jgi:hypothetical protein
MRINFFLAFCFLLVSLPLQAEQDPVRFATFNASLNRGSADGLANELALPGSAQPDTVAEIIQRVRPDVLLINEFDFDASGLAAQGYQNNYLSVAHGDAAPISYPYHYVAPSNTGIPSGFDLDNNGSVGGPNDAFGFGFFPGQFGMVVYSMFPIDLDAIRTFQLFLWKDMPGALLPDDPNIPGSADWYSPDELDVFRLSSKSHWDVPIVIPGDDGPKTVHFLVSHPTPPVFDGQEDRNGTRNADEIRFWADYISPSRSGYIYDDLGQIGGLQPEALFVIAGDQNSDPFDGDSIPGSAQQLLDHPLINTKVTPSSDGAVEQSALQGNANTLHLSDPAFDTADFFDGFPPSPFGGAPGNLRADYVLPSKSLKIIDAAVFWPQSTDPLFGLVGIFPFPSSDHRLVWVDVIEEDSVFKKEITGGPDRDGFLLWYDDFSDLSGLTTNGSAAQAGSALRLTPALREQAGSAFTTSQVPLGPGGSFSTHFSFQITGSGGGGADGLAFLVQNDPNVDAALGGGGGNMGYSGITPSLAVEFDSWAGLGDVDANHVGTATNGGVGNGIAIPLGTALDGGAVFYAWVDYDGLADMLEVRVDTAPLRPVAPTLSQAGIGLAALLGGTTAHVGFTAATGGAFGNHDILSWHFASAAGMIDLVVPINVTIPTAYDFTITYDGLPAWIYDNVPAEWDVTDIEGEFEGSPNDLPIDCGDTTSFAGIYGKVDVSRGGKSGKKCNSSTNIWWMPGEENSLNVQTLARCHNSRNNKRCRPTSCGALYLNHGAIAYEKDKNGDVALDPEGNPIVITGPTDAICLAAVDDINGDGVFTWDGSGDEDGDNLTDLEEACGIGTDPCVDDTDGDGVSDFDEVASGCMDPLNPDTDGDTINDGDELAAGTDPCDADTDADGYDDNVDSCPVEGPADPAAGEILKDDGCIIARVSCQEIKDITSLQLVWNGPDGVDIESETGQVIYGIDNGDSILLDTPRELTGNDVEVFLSGAVSGLSQFHISCSDLDMDGSEDCGTMLGDGKSNDSSFVNDWLLDGMQGEQGEFVCQDF